MTSQLKMPKNAMVLAAGLGTRMRPITDDLPKPLVSVGGRTLIDHALDRLADAGIGQAVVNLHYLGGQIRDHLAGREAPAISYSEEDDLLETGGGVTKALPLLGEAPFFVINADCFWLNGPTDVLARMADIWRDDSMDALLLLHSTVDAYGYQGRGDFVAEPDGVLARRPENEVSPWLFAGLQIFHPRLFDDAPAGAFSLNLLYDKAIRAGRLYGMVHDGEWFHVGTAAGLAEAEAYIGMRYAGMKRR